MEWAAEFYKKQFLLTKRNLDEISKSTHLQEVLRIQEQIGKPFFKVLELGASNGQLANALANKNYEVTSVELVEELVQFTKENTSAPVNILCRDFYIYNI